jgi:hypothetical protein
VHEANINGIAGAGIAQGEGPDTYGANDPVTREQMASFLIRWFAVHEAGGDVTPLPPNVGPDLLSSTGLDTDQSFNYTPGDTITLTFANPVGIGTTITLTDGFSNAVTLTDAPSPHADETKATFAMSNNGRTLTITPTEAVQFSSGSSFSGGFVTITDSSGITDVDSAVEWNPDKEPIGDVRFEFEQPA